MDAPKFIEGTRVEPNGKPLTLNGQEWLTMVPVDPDDERLWEFSITTGHVVKTRTS